MPIFWRYLLGHYLKVLLLSTFSFIAILLVSRLEEIAQFAALGAKIHYLALFTLYQIPYILPIAIPISCLISSMLLFQQLSQTHELTALRASGLSLTTVLMPLLLASVFFSFLNFYITSELATASHLATRKMAYEISSVNPLVLLQNSKIAKLKGAYVQMSPVRNGEAAEDLFIAMNHRANNRLYLLLAQKLEMKKNMLSAAGVSLISSIPSKESQDFDHLMIENENTATSSAPEFARLLRNQGWRMANDHLKFSLLRVRIQTAMDKLRKLNTSPSIEKTASKKREARRTIYKCYSEVTRRFAFGLAPLTFTLMGTAFGMHISRYHSKKGLLLAIFLAALLLTSFFAAKGLESVLWLSIVLFLFPHVLIAYASFRTLTHINRGIE